MFGRKDVVQTRVVDLNEAVTDATMLLRPLLGDRHELLIALYPGNASVEADPAQIQRLLMNLVMNAGAAMPGGGTVEIRTRSVVLGDDADRIGLSAGEHVRLTVRDSGTGMAPEVVRRAFEPFFTTKAKGEERASASRSSTGSRSALGDTSRSSPSPARGRAWSSCCQRSRRCPSNPVAEERPAETEGHGEVVLVVDDDEALRRSTARILSAHGYEVLEAVDGMDALERYRELDPSPAVLVTDVSMPRMTGPQLAAAVRDMEPRTHVVFMSGYAEGLEEVGEDAPLVAKPLRGRRPADGGVAGPGRRRGELSVSAVAISVLVADDHPLYRDALATAVARHPGLELVGQAETGTRALDAIERLRPDVAVLDARMPEIEGTEILQRLQRMSLGTKVVLVSGYLDGGLAYEAIARGAGACFSKLAEASDICDAIVAVAAGETVIPAEVQSHVAREIRQRAVTERPELTDRELQILRRIADGASAPTIAGALGLSPATVKTHLRHVYEKLGVSDRAAAVAESMRRGIL